MMFATPLGLLALLAIPAIVAIHLFRRRFPVRPVAGLFLWQMASQRPEGGGKIAKLPITRSLVLECLAALALALILAGARLSPSSENQHLVVLLDDSASMSAVDGNGESPRDRALRRVVTEIDRLGSGAHVTLVQSGERPSVLSGPAATAVEARRALDSWAPLAPHHTLALGVRLARELAGRTGTLMILTDGTPQSRGDTSVEGALWVAVGEPLDNVAITGAQRTASPDLGRGTISLTLGNYSGRIARRHVRVLAGNTQVFATDVDAAPGTSSLNLPIPPGLPPVRVALSDDALRRDNEVVLADPRPRLVGVENRLPDGRGRQALIKALGVLQGVTRAEPGDLAFTDGTGLDAAAAPGGWRVAFGVPGAPLRASGEPQDFAGPFVLEKRHPLLLGVSLGGVVWTGVSPLAVGAVRPLASAGDRALIGVTGATANPTFVFNIDLNRTNLIRAPDWPILISNLVEMRRQMLPGPERWNYRIGEWVRVRLGRDPRGPLRFRCGGIERALPAGRTIEFAAPSPGGLLQIFEGDQQLFELGINFLDEDEANLRDKSRAEIGAFSSPESRLRAESGAASDPLFWVLLAAGAGAIMANWCLGVARRSVA